jgi:hypothetical protein
MASHDLQEPLRKIRMFSDRLLSRYGDILKDDVQMLLRIQQSAERTQALIADILDFSKISIEQSEFTNSDLNSLLEELISDMDEEIKQKEATITLDKMPSLYVSKRLMRPLFQNLIANALKYAKKNEAPVVHIHSEMAQTNVGRNGSEPNKYCRIFVEDNGIGFDQKYAEDIFGMFKRLHNNGEYEGTGIGLALCKKIVEQHNGFITARSKPGEGSTFIISLPVRQAVPA